MKRIAKSKKSKKKKNKENKAIIIGAYDPILGMRTLYVVKNGIARSAVTGHTFKVNINKLFKKSKNG